MSGNRSRVPDRIRHMLEAADNIRSDIGTLSQEHFLMNLVSAFVAEYDAGK